jgi:hypothetical protein
MGTDKIILPQSLTVSPGCLVRVVGDRVEVFKENPDGTETILETVARDAHEKYRTSDWPGRETVSS